MKPIILISCVLTACGSSGGSGNSQPPATNTTTSTQTSTGTTTTGPKVDDIIATLAQIQLCKPLGQQPASVQQLVAAATTNVIQGVTADPTGADTFYTNPGFEKGFPSTAMYSDGTRKIGWLIKTVGATKVLLEDDYRVDQQTEVDNPGSCH